MKRNAYKPGPSLIDLLEDYEAIIEAYDDCRLEQLEAQAQSRAAQPSYREQYQ